MADQASRPTDQASLQTQDDFWDIEKLLPKKNPAHVRHAPATSFSTETTEITVPPRNGNVPAPPPAQETPIPRQDTSRRTGGETAASAEPAPAAAYRPVHPLIREVRVFPWRSGFRFYERFCEMAEHFFDCGGEACEPVPFFSYMPQYDQMSRHQLSWYFYWRDRVRTGEYPKTDYSYIFLLLFEIINLPEKILPVQGQAMMCALWRNYRRDYPLLNRYLADWICDYSLIHRLPPPTQALGDLFGVLSQQATLREFYACPSGDDDFMSADAYLWFCTNYDYRKSKAYLENDQRRAAFDCHIPRVIEYVLSESERRGQPFTSARMQCVSVSRDAYIGALCSYRAKRRIEVDYCSFSRSHELRFLVTEMVKYAENKLRAVFGVKSRLSVKGVPDDIRALMDAYFAGQFPHRKGARDGAPGDAEERPAYERLYDLPQEELSMDRALLIEEESWGTTGRLVEAFDDRDDKDVLREEDTAAPSTEMDEKYAPTVRAARGEAETAPRTQSFPQPLNSPEPQPKSQLQAQRQPNIPSGAPRDGQPDVQPGKPPEDFAPYEKFIRCALCGDREGQRDFARSHGELPDAVADRINELAADTLGDILLEADEAGCYTVLSEYRDVAESLVSADSDA